MGRLGPTPNSDDWAQYLLHAQALAEGRAYTDIDYVFSHYAWGTGSPIAAPGLPLTLVPVLATVGFQHWMHVGFNMLGIVILMALICRYFGRYNPTRATTAAMLVGSALILVRGADTLQPDIPFAALIWGVLLLADSVEDWTWARTAGIALLGLWVLLYRVAGLPLIPAMAVFGVLTLRVHRSRPFIITAIWVLATAYLFLVVESGRIPPPADYIQIPPDSGDGPSIFALMLQNAFSYRLSMFEVQLYPFATGTLNDVYHVIMTPIVLIGALIWLEGSWFRLAAVFGAAYMGMLLVAPFAVERYVWPLWPLGAYGLVVGLDFLLDKIRSDKLPRGGFRSAAVVGVIILIAAMNGVRRDMDPSVYRLDTVQELVEFAKNVPEEEEPVFVFFLPRSFVWNSGVPTMTLFQAPSDEAVLREMREQRVTHVILGTLGHPSHIAGLERWTGTISRHPEQFEVAFENEDFTIYEVQPAPELR